MNEKREQYFRLERTEDFDKIEGCEVEPGLSQLLETGNPISLTDLRKIMGDRGAVRDNELWYSPQDLKVYVVATLHKFPLSDAMYNLAQEADRED